MITYYSQYSIILSSDQHFVNLRNVIDCKSEYINVYIFKYKNENLNNFKLSIIYKSYLFYETNVHQINYNDHINRTLKYNFNFNFRFHTNSIENRINKIITG